MADGQFRKALLLPFIFGVIFLAATVPVASGQDNGDVSRLSKSELSQEDQTLYITDVWKFSSADNIKNANPSLVDSSWQQVSTYLGPSELPFVNWDGIGWFRLHLKADSSLVNYPLALLVQQHNGASEVYWDGEKIAQIGQIGTSNRYQAQRSFNPIPLVFADTTEHVLAVRYANHDAAYFNSFHALGFTAGFRFLLGDLNFHTSENATGVPKHRGLPVFFIGSLLAFTIIHFLLYAFYPAGKRNLYFALFAGALALLMYALYITGATGAPLKALFYYRFSLICWLITVIMALRFTYSLLYEKTPVSFWFFSAAVATVAVFSWYYAEPTALFREILVLLTLLEIIRILVLSFLRQKSGIWIVGTGILCFIAGIFYKILIDLGLAAGDPVAANIYGSSALIFAMSIYLSRDFAITNRRLEQKLLEVRHLSERSLKQERINREKEIERKLLSAENERKSKELEEARALQLSMLPKNIPGNEHWDIAVFMETAYEVGGDYYDFRNVDAQNLTIALGDATGHGMKAGIMVAAAKSYFHTLADKHEVLEILHQMSAGIRNMDLKTMFMGFQLLQCHERKVTLATAGMPPVLWYQPKENQVCELLLKGLPLGTRVKYPYKKRMIEVASGDVLVLMSDGLTELFDKNREQLGTKRIKKLLLETGDATASDILSQITKLIDQWSGGVPQHDDITVMVMKAKK